MDEIVVDAKMDFQMAEKVAKSIAEKKGNAILLAYHDNATGEKFPNVECCGERSWEIYAINRGGNLRVRVGNFEFIFRVE
ncbi:MAG: AF1514 family protein [Archaeoglobaceae archaeon]